MMSTLIVGIEFYTIDNPQTKFEAIYLKDEGRVCTDDDTKDGGHGSMVLSASLAEKTMKHFVIFFFDCPTFKPSFDSLWCNMLLKASNLNVADGTQISQFITNLDWFHKTLLLFGCLRLPFHNTTVTSINKFIASAVAKIYKIRTEKLHELEAPWLLK